MVAAVIRLAPYAAVAGLVAALGFGWWWSVTSHAQTRAERDALQQRIKTLETVKDLQDEAANDSDDALAGSISDVQQPR